MKIMSRKAFFEKLMSRTITIIKKRSVLFLYKYNKTQLIAIINVNAHNDKKIRLMQLRVNFTYIYDAVVEDVVDDVVDDDHDGGDGRDDDKDYGNDED